MAGLSLQAVDGNAIQAASVSSTSGTITAITGTTGLILRVYKLFLVVTGAVTLTFEDGSTALSGAIALSANGAITLDMDGNPWFTCSPGNNFTIVQSGGTQVSGTVYYTQSKF